MEIREANTGGLIKQNSEKVSYVQIADAIIKLPTILQTMGDLSVTEVESSPDVICQAEGAGNVGQSRRKLRDLLAIPGVWGQVYAAFALSVAAFLSGIAEGWPGCMSLKLDEPQTRILFKDDQEGTFEIEIRRIYTFMLLSALVHLMLTGMLMDRFGRKAGCWFLHFIAPSGWVFLASARTVEELYVGAAFIGSIAVSGVAAGVIYVSEISNDLIRGPLISLLMFFNSLGILFAHVLGEELDFRFFHLMCFLLSLSSPFFFWSLPESPQFLTLKSRLAEARESIAWYHGDDPATVELEMKKLEKAKRFDWRECRTLMGTKGNRRAIEIVLGLSVLTELIGTSMIEVFAGTTISRIPGAKFTARVASMVLASCRFTGGILNVYFVERAGRKSTLKTSLLKMSICIGVLCLCLYLTNEQSHSIPEPSKSKLDIPSLFMKRAAYVQDTPKEDETVYLYAFYGSTISLIVYTLANQMFLGTTEVLCGELLSAETKGAMMAFGGSARIGTLIFCNLIYKFSLNYDRYGMGHFFFICMCCVLGAHITNRCIPETQGKTLNEIHKELGETCDHSGSAVS